MSEDSPIAGRLGARAALVIAHPGHELRMHGWLEQARRVVCVLTDGSGSTSASRIHSTSRVLRSTGAHPGGVFGRYTDRELYSQLLSRRVTPWLKLVDELANTFVRHGVSLVACDAVEGYNPSHDLCRLLAECAVRRAGRIALFDFPLVSPPMPPSPEDGALTIRLDDVGLERKLAAARDYSELAGETDAALRMFGADALRHECLQPARTWFESAAVLEQPPYYERFGEERVAAGHYSEVVRYREHLLPIAEALARSCDRSAA